MKHVEGVSLSEVTRGRPEESARPHNDDGIFVSLRSKKKRIWTLQVLLR